MEPTTDTLLATVYSRFLQQAWLRAAGVWARGGARRWGGGVYNRGVFFLCTALWLLLDTDKHRKEKYP